MYLISLSALLAAVGVVQLQWVWKRRRRTAASWEELLCRVEQVDLEGIEMIAECRLQSGCEPSAYQLNQMWNLLGGLDGLNRLYHNAELMLELAVFVEQWQHPQAALIAERIRTDGVKLRGLVASLQFRMLLGRTHRAFASELQEAAATYCFMRRHVSSVPAFSEAF